MDTFHTDRIGKIAIDTTQNWAVAGRGAQAERPARVLVRVIGLTGERPVLANLDCVPVGTGFQRFQQRRKAADDFFLLQEHEWTALGSRRAKLILGDRFALV